MLKPEEIQYILENEGAETSRLLLGRHPAGINVPLCVKCIEARKKMKIKAPLWHSFPSLVYPFSVSVEQGSSQATALFKQQLILDHLRPSTSSTSTNGGTFVDEKENLSGRARGIITADLTGGMGIDSFFISRIAEKHYYFERNTELCEATAYNFGQLSAENIIVSNRDITADGCAALEELKGQGIDLLYIDPARRLADGKKAILLQDYEPNVVDLQEKMFEVSPNLLV